MVDSGLDGNLLWSRDSDAQRTSQLETMYQILLNYDRYKFKLERLQRTLANVVKPQDFDTTDFVM